MKMVNGIELLQMIKEEKIKANTEIKVYFNDGVLKEYQTTIKYDGTDLKWKEKQFYARYFYDEYVQFEILEVKPEEIMRNRYIINKLSKAINYLLKNK